jgi:hypothetical protein
VFSKQGEARLWLNRTHGVHRIAQYQLVNAPRGSNSPGRIVSGFLKHVADVPARPFPVNFVFAGGAIQTFPRRQIALAAKTTVHRFDDVTRVGKQLDVARLAQRFESDCRRDNLRLLIRGATEILADCPPMTSEAKQSDRRRPTRFLSVAKTRSVAKNCHLLEGRHGYRLLFCRIFCIGEKVNV